MKRRIVKLSVLTGLLIGLMLLFAGGAWGAENPISCQMEIRPDKLTGTGNVSVSINIINVSDGGETISVTLYDPAGNVCSGFGSGGTASLAPGGSAAYNGDWTVTQKQLDAGKVAYTARYSLRGADGQAISASQSISKPITANKLDPKMEIKRITPDGAVTQGQTVTISYKITNTGTVDLFDIRIEDPNIIKNPVTLDSLAVGETKELSYSYTAGEKAMTTQGTMYYKYLDGDKPQEKSYPYSAIEIPVTVPDLLVELSAKQLIVNPGDKIDLVCVITNKSELSYQQIKVQDATLGDVESGLSLAAGASKEIKKPITVNATRTYKFVISGVDANGKTIAFQSNELTIQTTGGTASDSVNVSVVPVRLEIVAEADRDIIYELNSEILFRIKVTNNGDAAVEKVTIQPSGYYGTDKVFKTIDKIEPGETYEFIKEFTASMGGEYQFTAKVKDNTGATVEALSNVFPVVYQEIKPPVTPTPVPTAAPTPASTPDTTQSASPWGENEPDKQTGTGTILLWVLFGLLAVILLAVAALFIMDRRRNAPQSSAGAGGPNVVIDSIQRSPHRDYARAPKRAPAPSPREQTRKKADAPEPAYGNEPDEDALYGEAPSPRMNILDVEEEPPKRSVPDDVYRRPGEPAKPASGEAVLETPATPKEETQEYGGEYLTRIRQKNAPAAAPVKEPEVLEEQKPVLTDEEAALLSGSTGQYRLSRRTAAVPGRQPAPPVRKVENPEEFARRSRAASAKPASLSSFYDDDEDGTEEKKNAPRRRR